MESVSADIPMQHFLVLSSILFSIGVFGVLSRRNAVMILMSVELMLNAVSINMVTFAVYTAPSLFVGIIFAIFVITIAAVFAAATSAVMELGPAGTRSEFAHVPAPGETVLGRDFATACDWFTANPNNHHWLRPYQREANAAVEGAIAARKRNMMLAMATGCGSAPTRAS